MAFEELKDSLADAYDLLSARIPHFPYVLGAVLVGFLGIIAFLFFTGTQSVQATVVVQNVAGVGIRGADVNVNGLDEPLSLVTDSYGKAVFSVPLGRGVSISVSKEGYATENRDFTPQAGTAENAGQAIKIVLKGVARAQPGLVTMTFVGPDGKKLTGKAVRITLGCTGSGDQPGGNPVAFDTPQYTVTDGQLEVTPPAGCGSIRVSASAANLQDSSATVLGYYQEISFQGIEQPKGSIDFEVKDANTGAFLDNIGVTLVDQLGQSNGFETQTSFGQASFAGVGTGNYTVQFHDLQGRYADAQLPITITPNGSDKKEVELAKDIKVRAKVRVIDGTGSPVEGATVSLLAAGGSVATTLLSGPDGTALFMISDDGAYSFSAGKDGYLPADINSFTTTSFTRGSEQDFTATLGNCTQQTCGLVNVRVLDEDGLPVENAEVVLLDSAGFVLNSLGSRTTDWNGFAQSFRSVPKGTYSALAQKFPADGNSGPFTVDPTGVTNVQMTLTIGTGIVTVKALDKDNNPISFAQAEVKATDGTSIGTVALDSQGNAAPLQVKADKRVYAVFRKSGYEPYYTVARQVLPNGPIEFDAVMEKSIEGNKPSIEFTGIASKAGGAATSLKAGNSYTARFILRVPEQQFDVAGVFFRAGSADSLEKDSVSIDSVNFPQAGSGGIVKGTTYNPPLGPTGGEQVTNGSAKWVSATMNGPEPGKYEVEFTFTVKDSTPQGTAIPLEYRAWGASGDSLARDPEDSTLGSSQSVAPKGGLYAQTYEKSFIVGMDELCSGDFCFTTRLLNQGTGLYEDTPYKLETFSPYSIEFTLTNNSQALLDNASISIRNSTDGTSTGSDVSITSYDLRNADSRDFTGATPAYAIDPVAMGSFRQNKTFSGTLGIEAKSGNPSAIEFTVVSANNKVFDDFLQLLPFSQQDINVSVYPQAFPPLTSIDMNVKATYTAGDQKGFGVQGGIVTVRRIAPDSSQSTMTAATDTYGNATLTVPASSPGTKLLVQVEKPGIGAEVTEVDVGDSVVQFTPDQLSVTLDRQTSEEQKTGVTMQSLLGKSLVVKSMAVLGTFNGILDEERMSNFLAQYTGSEIPPNSSKGVQVLSALGSGAQELNAPVTLNGGLYVELGLKDDPSTVWASQVPMATTVNLAEMPANAPCISVSANNWEDSTLSNSSSLQFEVQNNCVDKGGNPMTLNDLQGQLNWSGSDGMVGQVELSITDPASGDVSSEVLQQGTWSRMASTLKPRLVYPAALRFVPKPGSLGKRAQFSVKIDAQLATNSGEELVGATNDVSADIMVANLDQCVNITPNPQEGIELGASDKEQQFTLDTTQCGKAPIDIRFCGGGSDFCRGGTTEGGIKVSPWSFSAVSASTRNAKVARIDVPGIYGLAVEARPSGHGSWRQIANIDTTVDPEEGDYFTMDKYSFNTIGKGAKDSANLTNSMLLENVQVKANLCAWKSASPGLGDAEKAGIGLAGAVAGAGIGYGAALLGVSVLGASVIGLIVFVIILFLTLFGDDPCQKWDTHTLQDFVINLAGTSDHSSPRYVPPDAMAILMSDSRFRGEWNLGIADAVQKINAQYPHGKQVVGVMFTNINAVDDKPVYAMATLRSKEHVHGDATHQNASVQCGSAGSENGDFGFFWINPSECNTAGGVYDTVYQQKFHIKFSVAEEHASLPKVDFDTYACQSGTDIGRTGHGALPRVKLGWSWKQGNGGITLNQCDAQNPDYVYCDATQFTIEVNKKLDALHEFLQANSFDLGCPLLPDERKQAADQIRQLDTSNTVPRGALGLEDSNATYSGTTVRISVNVRNGTASDQNLVVSNTVTNGSGQGNNCAMDIRNVPANGAGKGTCSVNVQGNGLYAVASSVQSSTAGPLSIYGTARTGVYVGDPLKSASDSLCSLKTTETLSGEPQIMRFLDGKHGIKWTAAVPDENALSSLLGFDAFLEKDDYTKKFFSDFADYYTNTAFEDADSYFHSLGTDTAGNKFGFNRLMQQGKFIVTQKYVQSPDLPGPGLYHAEIAAYFNGGDWRILDGDGNPQGYVSLVLYKKDDPFPDSPFYSMPLDGLVGLRGNNFTRQGYGVTYKNSSQELLDMTSGQVPLKSYEDAGSNPVNTAQVTIERGLYALNSSPSTRGMLLSVSNQNGANSRVVFQPSHATPVILQASRDSTTGQPFSSSYTALENNTPVDVGSTLAYWDGAGTCLDFTGVPVTEAFYEKPDRKADASDKLADITNFYSAGWPNAVKKGNVYLRTIMYTPQNQDVELKASQQSTGTGFLTPDNAGQAVPVNGVQGMQYNDLSAGEAGTVNSMQDVFTLVDAGRACVTNTGDTTKVFWNPQKVYDWNGTRMNISRFTNSLDAGVSCIG